MNPIVEFCVNNAANGTQPIIDQLEHEGKVEVVTYDCLNECVVCAKDFFALVEGKLVRAATPTELVTKIYNSLEEDGWLE
ncbi:YuzB family protein [Carnobacterium gallinarum]|uniref:YuzB family protein n=1 Tax=Carnobacterium gallinarum TaxID=2749 RepID=UPI0005570DBA|nr:YuzB family protein [Carnobacterium gallinarum]